MPSGTKLRVRLRASFQGDAERRGDCTLFQLFELKIPALLRSGCSHDEIYFLPGPLHTRPWLRVVAGRQRAAGDDKALPAREREELRVRLRSAIVAGDFRVPALESVAEQAFEHMAP